MRISDWSSDVCSSDLRATQWANCWKGSKPPAHTHYHRKSANGSMRHQWAENGPTTRIEKGGHWPPRSEEHTSELQSLMRISYAVFCLKKKMNTNNLPQHLRTQTT